MKIISRFLNKETAMSTSNFMKYICYIIMFILSFGIFMSLMGRQTFILHSRSGVYERTTYSQKDPSLSFTGPSVSLADEVRIITNTENNNIDLISQVGLSAMYILSALPVILSFYFLAIVFKNVSENNIFTKQNANYLLYYALIQIFVSVVTPFLKLFLCFLTNLFTNNIISVSTGQQMINNIIPNIAFIVAAYIIHYGVNLQDEADHTL